MIPFAAAVLISAFFSIIAGILLYGRNPSHAINRILLVFAWILFVWGFTEFECLQANDVHLALIWMRLNASWYLIPAVALHMSILYSNLTINKPILYSSAYAPPIILAIYEISAMPYQPVLTPWGWDYYYTGYFGYVELLWGVLASVAALFIIMWKYRNAKSREEKTGVAYVFLGFLIPMVAGISYGVLLLFSLDVPDLTMPASAIGFFVVGYAVWRHGSFILTASTAAEDILSTMPDALFLVNSRGEITVSNRTASTLLESRRSELVGKMLTSLSQDPRLMEAQLRDSPSTGFEIGLKSNRGQVIPVSVSKSRILTRGGDLAGWILICRDITERKRMEQRLLNAERMGTIGETTSMVGHDLRNPLQAIVGALYLATKELRGSSEWNLEPSLKSSLIETFETIEQQVGYMNKIVSDLQDYAAPLKSELTELDINAYVENTLSQMDVPQGIRITFTPYDSPLRIMMDTGMMKRIFTNLITNAIQAMPEGGELRVGVSKTDEEVSVSFRDTGVGIAEEDMNKLFQPLFTTKAKGQGFGLSVCRRLSEAQGGSIAAQSKRGEGSTFTVKLPIRR